MDLQVPVNLRSSFLYSQQTEMAFQRIDRSNVKTPSIVGYSDGEMRISRIKVDINSAGLCMLLGVCDRLLHDMDHVMQCDTIQRAGVC